MRKVGVRTLIVDPGVEMRKSSTRSVERERHRPRRETSNHLLRAAVEGVAGFDQPAGPGVDETDAGVVQSLERRRAAGAIHGDGRSFVGRLVETVPADAPGDR